MTSLAQVLQFLAELQKRKIHYQLGSFRDDALMVRVDVPNQRWEVEFLVGGEIEVEIFDKSSGVTNISLEELLRKLEPYSD
jgi:predicted ester cyclase